MKRFPEEWLKRLNEMVKVARRRHGFDDIVAVVDPPYGPDSPPILRLEKAGTMITEPIDPRAVEQMVRTGQEGPMLILFKQAFLRVEKAAGRRAEKKAGVHKKGAF
jgi:hypothetical protein